MTDKQTEQRPPEPVEKAAARSDEEPEVEGHGFVVGPDPEKAGKAGRAYKKA